MQKINPFLWFDSQAEEAAEFYTSIFRNSKILNVTRYTKAAANMTGQPPGSVLTVAFQLDGQRFVALNGGPGFKINEAISLVVNCKTQAELDRFWKRLSAGGEQRDYGWLKDKYGVSWQIVPSNLDDLLGGKDPARNERVMAAVLRMTKLDIKKLKRAAAEVGAIRRSR